MMNFLFFGPKTPPVHGQSFAFTKFYDYASSKYNIHLINTNFENKHSVLKMIFTFYVVLKSFYFIFFKKTDKIYFTCSRSILGSLKDLVLIKMANIKNIPVINHLHGADFLSFIDNSPDFYKKILIKSYDKVDISIVLTDEMKEQFKYFKNMKLETVYNFYDSTLEVEKISTDSKEIRVLYLSNIIKSKGILDLLDAAEVIENKDNTIKFDIAGAFMSDEFMTKEEIKKIFSEKIKNLSNTKYHGPVKGNYKKKLLVSSHIFVLPSYYKSEAFPITIIEAMVTGNAIIVTNHNYLPYIVGQNNGVVINKNDPDAIANAILNLVKNKSSLQKIRENNMIYAKENFSEEKYLKRLEEIIKQ